MSAAIYTYSARAVPGDHARQMRLCEDLAHELGLTVTRFYGDGSGARHALARLLADAEQGDLAVVFVAALDRFGRVQATASRVIAKLHEAGVTIYAVPKGVHPITDDPASST